MSSSDQGTAHDATGGATQTRGADEPRRADSLIAAPKGATLGRYTILEKVGEGATGAVYSAYDPELDRRVALKVIHRAHRRSRREALAMARVAHANVVTIYDVGEHDGRLFLAMEFADGGTVADWLATRRPWREVLHVFERAGRGLDAVHRAGLVHRDFKPANILLFKSGDVRVSDFGLARAVDGDVADSGEVTSSTPEEVGLTDTLPTPSVTPSSSLRDRLTRPGDSLGTPLFMSPEQHRGEAATALSDQFAFAVALHEALFGEVPFPGSNRAALLAALERATPTFPARSPVPSWVRRALARALAFRPADRFPTMGALLTALAPRRRWMGLAFAAGLGLAGVAAVMTMTRPGRSAPEVCATPAIAPDDLWNDARRAEVRASLVASEAPFAAAAANAVSARLDAWASQLRAVEHEACLLGGAAHPAQLECLADSKAEVAALLDVLVHADRAVAGRAVAAAQGISSPQTCARARPERPTWAPAVASRARRTLAAAKALVGSGRQVDAASLASVAATQATVAGDERTAARALTTLARMQMRVDPKRTVPMLEEALWRALAAGDDTTSIGVLVALVSACARADDYPASHRYARRAFDLLARAPDELQRADLLSNLSATLRREERAPEALPLLLEGLAIRERLLPPSSLDLAYSYHDLGSYYFTVSRYPEAGAAYQRALDIRLAALGPWHSAVASTYTNLGAVAFGMGDYEASAHHHRRALEIYATSLPAESVEMATARYNLGGAYFALKRWDEALAEYEVARRIYVARAGPDSPDVVDVVADVADVRAGQERWDEALAGYAEALAMVGKQGDDDGLRAALVRSRRARTYLAMGRHLEAIADADLAARAVEKVFGPQHIELATALRVRGEAELALGRRAAAIASLERALAIREALPADHAELEAVRALVQRARDLGPR